MADNLNVTSTAAGSAFAVKTDEIGNVHYGVVKLAVGGSGASSGYVGTALRLPVEVRYLSAANPLHVTGVVSLSAGNPPLSVSAAGGEPLPVSFGSNSAANPAHVTGTVSVSAGNAVIPVDLAANSAANPAHVTGVVTVSAGNSPLPVSAASPLPMAIATDVLATGGVGAQPAFAAINVPASTGSHQVVAAQAGKKIRVISYHVVVPGSVEARFVQGSAGGTELTGGMNLVNGVAPAYSPQGLFETAASAALLLKIGAAVSAGGVLTYVPV